MLNLSNDQVGEGRRGGGPRCGRSGWGRAWWWLLALAVWPGAAVVAAEEKVLAILATVNGEPITLYDILLETGRVETQLATLESPAELPRAVRRLRREAVDGVIDRKLLFAEFEARSYRVPEQMVEQMLDALAASYAGGSREGLVQRAEQDGMTKVELRAKARERVAVDLLLKETCERTVEISPAQVLAYYEQHREQCGEVGRTSLQVLLLKRDGQLRAHPADFPERLQEELVGATAEQFTAMVRLYSEGPNRDDDGRTGWLTDAALRPEFAAAVSGLEVGQVTGPVILPEGLCFLRVDRRVAARELPFVAVKDKLKKELEQAERDQRYRTLVDQLRARAVIRIFFDEQGQD